MKRFLALRTPCGGFFIEAGIHPHPTGGGLRSVRGPHIAVILFTRLGLLFSALPSGQQLSALTRIF
ncbi:hypothetical protein [Rhizobium sp. KDH_Rht_773_N]